MVENTSGEAPSASTYEYKIDVPSSPSVKQSPSKVSKLSSVAAKGDNLWNSILQDVVKRDE
jgi:dynein light intermediate chain 1